MERQMWSAWMFALLMAEPTEGNALAPVISGTWAEDSTPQLQGPLPAASVRAGIEGKRDEVLRCYQALHAQYPELAGELEARFVITADGLATEVSAADARFRVGWFQGCLEDALNDARFPVAAEPTTVSWTLHLHEAAFSTGGVGGLIGVKGGTGGQWTSETSGAATAGADPIILGALDKSLIDAVIKRNMNQIRYCYQRELTKTPALSGKILVKFVIAKDGSVSSAVTKSTTMNSPAVEECLNGRFLRFQFPEPKGGGIVIVTYPFVFEPG